MSKVPISPISGKYRIIYIALLLAFALSILYWFLVRRGFIFAIAEIPEVLCLQGCPAEEKLHIPPVAKELLNYNKPLPELLGTTIDKQKISLLIEKYKHRLTVYYDLKPIKSYPVVFGGNPTGDKFKEGDKKTPEGILRVRDLYPHPVWSKFIWLNYPNPSSWRKHFQAKFQAKSNGKVAWSDSIGGEVGIHGVPEDGDNAIDARNNWTLGCPSLKNKDVEEIYQWVKVGTIVEIVP
jgi:L,D-transpeptidase catalytic domain